jgi:two-component system, NtrC family, response regulator AtoC
LWLRHAKEAFGLLRPDSEEEMDRNIGSDGAPQATLAEVRDRAERRHIRAVLADVDNRIGEAAKRLGVSRSTLFEKMRKLDIRSESDV